MYTHSYTLQINGISYTKKFWKTEMAKNTKVNNKYQAPQNMASVNILFVFTFLN